MDILNLNKYYDSNKEQEGGTHFVPNSLQLIFGKSHSLPLGPFKLIAILDYGGCQLRQSRLEKVSLRKTFVQVTSKERHVKT